jgi:nitrate reductase assembly molybdenum cofactor insertion protein NarJ
MDEEIKRTLEKQLELLSERSEKSESNKDLADITHAMCEMADRLLCNGNPYDFSSPESNV